jgi:transcriptional regulator with XRE-family HTH domain
MKPNQAMRAIRSARGLSQKQAALQAGINPMTLCRYERGETEPTQRIACSLADVYGVTLDQLAGREPIS